MCVRVRAHCAAEILEQPIFLPTGAHIHCTLSGRQEQHAQEFQRRYYGLFECP